MPHRWCFSEQGRAGGNPGFHPAHSPSAARFDMDNQRRYIPHYEREKGPMRLLNMELQVIFCEVSGRTGDRLKYGIRLPEQEGGGHRRRYKRIDEETEHPLINIDTGHTGHLRPGNAESGTQVVKNRIEINYGYRNDGDGQHRKYQKPRPERR